ncbi:MAG: hypothetical protein A3F13_07770 [Gammaproteobacteria bacterium RIFCSPHIGHO2_12_FULL_40_19]|nr:MAG: hypothetical protein A3F13_07770 [Gammaproteobacteria bacterium RIFCSPHIGHO2_12_FULL_40_19]
MNKWFETVAHYLSAKIALLIFCVLVIFHVVFVLHILSDNRVDRQAEKRSALIQKIANVVYLIQATPTNNREAAIAAIDDPAIHVTLTEQPASHFQYNQASYWKMIHALENNLHAYFVSVQLDDNEWLNIKGTLYTRLVLNQLLFVAVEFIVFGAILIAFLSVTRFTVPLRKIKSSAEQLGIDLETKPFAVYGPKVVREASQALNQMRDRILQLVHNRTQLLASISHDLRTPIARAQLRAQFIEDSEYKTQLLNDLSEMEHMISETLSFAREDSRREEMKNIDLVSLLLSICDDACDMGHNVVFHANAQRIAFVGRPIALKRALTNLINNAIRYAGNAVVTIEGQAKSILITVEDNGPGILEPELEKVFEPFYRSEQSRSRDTGGVGLGLSVTRDIIFAHHGKIKLSNKKPNGLLVTIKLGLIG